MIKEQKKGAGMFLIVILLMTICVGVVHAIGVGPSRQYVPFSEGGEIEGELYVTNQEKQAFKLGVYAEGDMASYVEFEETLIDVDKNDIMVAVPYKIKFPKINPRPGENKIQIVLRPFPEDTLGEAVKATVAVIAEIVVRVPYPGKYAEGKLFISDAEDMDKPTTFVIMIYNYGEEDIEQAKAHVEILSPTGEMVGSADTNKMMVSAKQETRLDAEIAKTMRAGSYTAKALIQYDGKTIPIEQEFDIGKFIIELSDVRVDHFRLGDVAKFDISLFNNWNKQIDGIYSEVIITDEGGAEMTRFKTAAVDIPAEQVKVLEGYWYTEGVMPGYYTVKFIVHYDGKITQKTKQILVDTNKIEFMSGTGQATGGGATGKTDSTNLLMVLIIAVVVLLIAMNMVWFYFLSKKFREK